MVFGGAKKSFGMGVVVANAWARVRWSDAEAIHQGENGGGLQGASVVSVQDHGVMEHGKVFGEGSTAQEGLRVRGVFLFPDLRSDDFAAKEIEDDVEFEEPPGHAGWQPGDIPTPDLVGRGRAMSRFGGGRTGGSGPTPVMLLAGIA